MCCSYNLKVAGTAAHEAISQSQLVAALEAIKRVHSQLDAEQRAEVTAAATTVKWHDPACLQQLCNSLQPAAKPSMSCVAHPGRDRRSLQNVGECFLDYFTQDEWQRLGSSDPPAVKLHIIMHRLSTLHLRLLAEPAAKFVASMYIAASFGVKANDQSAAQKQSMYKFVKDEYKKFCRHLPMPDELPPSLPNCTSEMQTKYPAIFEAAFSRNEPPVQCDLDVRRFILQVDRSYRCRGSGGEHPAALPMQGVSSSSGVEAILTKFAEQQMQLMTMMMGGSMQMPKQLNLEFPKNRRALTFDGLADEAPAANSRALALPFAPAAAGATAAPAASAPTNEAVAAGSASATPVRVTTPARDPVRVTTPARGELVPVETPTKNDAPAGTTQTAATRCSASKVSEMLCMLDAREEEKKKRKIATRGTEAATTDKKRRLNSKTSASATASSTPKTTSATKSSGAKPKLEREATRNQWLVRCGSGKGSTRAFKYDPSKRNDVDRAKAEAEAYISELV